MLLFFYRVKLFSMPFSNVIPQQSAFSRFSAVVVSLAYPFLVSN